MGSLLGLEYQDVQLINLEQLYQAWAFADIYKTMGRKCVTEWPR